MNLNCNILHVEDDDNDSLFFQRALARLQFKGAYRRVSSVAEAINYLRASNKFADRALYPMPDVLVLDSAVPGGETAIDLMDWLDGREEFRSLKRIMLTGGMSSDSERVFLERGAAAVLMKGSTLDDLAISVEDVLRRCLL